MLASSTTWSHLHARSPCVLHEFKIAGERPPAPSNFATTPVAVISCAVRWYFRFQLSLRDIEELLFERGVIVSYETIRRWRDKFGADFAHRARAARRAPGITRHLDEVFVTLRGQPYLLWRAVDQHGAELDILLQKRRDKAVAKRFFKRALVACPEGPCKIVTDQLRSYPAARAEITELAHVNHVFVRASARLNNRAENSHQPTRERERRMRGFRVSEHTQAFLSKLRSDPAALRAQATSIALLHASLYRKQLAARFAAWHHFAEITQDRSAF